MSSVIIDIYPFLAIKKGSDLLQRISVSLQWVPEEHRRRLEAYTVLAAYAENLSRVVRSVEETDLHEYGDPNFVATAMASAVLGDKLSIVATGAEEQEKFFREWAEKELLFAKMYANEYKASMLGDCVYKLSYSPLQKRARVTTLDPGFWFPSNIGEADERHTFAWEEKNLETGIVEIYREDYTRVPSDGGNFETRLTAGFYKKSSTGSLADLSLVRYAKDESGSDLQNVSLGIDFFPIVWVPNILREGWDFGASDFSAVWRIFDELTNTYTDEASNAYLMGLAQIWASDKAFELLPIDKETGKKTLEIGRNRVIPGEAGVVDNSSINKALIEYQDRLEKKLQDNTFLGPMFYAANKTGSGDRTTGIFQIKGSPLERFVGVKRLLREAKYNRLIRYVAQMTAVHTEDRSLRAKFFRKNGEFHCEARIQFGNILPVDQTALVDNVEKVMDRLGNRDLKDNIRESGLIVNEDLKDAPEPTRPAPGKSNTAKG